MKISVFLKSFVALILSSFLVLSAGTAYAKRLTAAVPDWTGWRDYMSGCSSYIGGRARLQN